ncbi:DUF2933 domain-containing protein [Humitalea rosea]|uniref:DUF2933 domain-containing protein n=1 Tax=Humitalea rosea TaxID=990373 RepID=UPI000DAD8486|nr:DUF2933 domain-containing protein [Humitalea rosea]
MVDETTPGSHARHPAQRDRGGWWWTRGGLVAIGFLLIGAFYLLREHYGHTLGALPYLLLLACPLMHLFMHHGHGHGHGGGGPHAGSDRGDGAK